MSGHRVEDAYPLSPLQEGMLFHALAAGEPGTYLTQVACTLAGPLDVACFERAWQSVARRHPALRTAFAWKSAESPIQVVGREVRIPFAVEDWSSLPAAERERLWEERLATDRALGMDPARAPLLRLFLAREREDLHRLLWTHHHLILDGWSVGIVLQEASAAYAAALRGDEPALPPVVPFRAYIAWLLRRDRTGEKSFWRGELAGITAPTSLPWSAGCADAASDRDGERILRLPETTVETVRARCRAWQITPGTLIYAAWAILLGRHAGEEDVIFGVTTAGRPADLAGVEGIVGLFINTLPLRVDIRSGQTVLPWLSGLQERQMEMRSHEHTPLVEVQGWSDVPRGRPLFESFVAFESSPADRAPAAGEGGVEVRGVRAIERTNYPLGVAASPSLAVRVTHDPSRFDPATVDRLLGHLGTLLITLVEEAGRPLGDLPLLGAGERAQLLAEWNDTSLPLPQLTVPDLIAARAAETPDAIAVVAGSTALSYGEMIARADLLARRLRGLGLRAGDVVGVSCGRTPELVVALLGVLRAGCVFLPLDPSHPRERLDWITADAGARLLVTPEWMVAGGGEEAGLPPIDLGSPAYLIYTSGTTGRPKGVLVEHRALAATLLGAAERFAFEATDRMPCVAPVPFDIFLFELLSPLLAGGTAMLVPLAPALDVERLVDLLQEATRFHAVPALMRQVVDAVRARGGAESFAALRTLFVGGDAVPPRLREDLRDVFPGAAVWVLYGPTEAAILCASHLVREEEGIQAPLGRPLPNVELRLCDSHGRLVPVGVPGDLWIGGSGVARGYQGRDELTAERFPWIEGRRFYRSGDRARWRPDGTLEFLGRIDQQVKIRGVRIEPAEIESVLAALPEVSEVAVVARPDASGETALLACVVGEGTAAGLRASLRARLPEAFVPSEIVLLDSLPLTPHGKVDRAALARLRGGSPEGAARRAPQGPVEEVVAGIWAEVLGREVVGAEDDFFELGGHSLLATRVMARLRATLGLELPLRELFEAPTVASLAARVATAERGDRPGAPPLRRAPRQDLLPLSFAQERLWFLHRLDPESAAYVLPLALRLSGPLMVPAWAWALTWVAERHAVLRTSFPEIAGVPRQRVHALAAVALPLIDVSALPPALREETASRLAQNETRRPFDVEQGPLVRAALVRLEAEEHAAFFSLHHLISDGWSMGVLVRELAAAYRAAAEGRSPAFPELLVQYGDYAVWQRSWLTGPVQETLLADWMDQLAGAPEILELPTDRPRPPVQSFRGAARPFALSSELSREVRHFSRRQGGTPFLTLLAALSTLLRRWCGQDDLTVGTPVAGRTHLETEPLIGLFLNTLVLRVRMERRLRFDALLAQVRETAFAAFSRQDLPFEKLVEALQPRRSLSCNPLFQVMLAYQNIPREEPDLPGLRVGSLELKETATQFDLELMAAELDGPLAGTLKLATDLFDPSTGERLLSHLTTLLAAAVAAPERSLDDLPLLTEGECHQLLREWVGAPADLPDGDSAHRRIAEQAHRTPDAVAVSCDGERLTYAELMARGDALAGRLVAEGAGPEVLVALLAERGPGFLTAVLAILSTGAAYLPLDGTHPPARLANVLRRSGAALALVDSAAADQLDRALAELPERGLLRVLPLEGGEGARSGERAPVSPESLAYAIFTSGSTGAPKGAMVLHRGMLNHLIAKLRDLDLGPRDRVAQTASQCFDISVWQMLAPLLVGGCVEILPDAVAHDPARLLDAVESTGVTVLETVPSLLRFLLDEVDRRGAAAPRLTALRWLIPTGEALPVELVRRWCSLYPEVAVINAYGPTECSDDVTHHVLRQAPADDATLVPIGRPVVNTRLMVLDPGFEAVPVGVVGQLCVGGPSVGRGYLGDPAQTAAAFLPDPHAAAPGARLYATGDLARFAAVGWLEFLGRLDQQVKVRGFRIELGEVERALAAHLDVAEAAAVAGRGGITAFVVFRTGTAADARALRETLRAVLPDYMVPGRIVPLETLPLSANGKLDRKALAGFEPEPEPHEPGGEPVGAVAELLAELWAQLLGIERVGAHDHFFDRGGHSLLATQLTAWVRRALGVELPLRDVFERPVFADMVATVEGLLRGAVAPLPPLVRVPRGGPLPLSSAQQRLWFFDRWEPGSSAYNILWGVRMEGELDAAALAGVLTEVVRRHEVLRTTYVDLDGEPAQRIAPPSRIPLALIDLAALPPVLREEEASRIAAADRARPFDLARGPVLRAALLRLASREHIALLTLHHIAADAWSTNLLTREIAALYAAFRERQPSPLPELPMQYADFAVWQRNRLADGSLRHQLDYWRERLRGLPELRLPIDRPRPAVQSFRGLQSATSLPFVAALRCLARTEDATLFMVLLAGFAIVLAHRSGQDDVVVGTNVAGRTQAEVEGLIGFFLNMLVLRTDLSGDPPFRELLARVRETALGAYAHQDLPFDRLVEVLRVRRDPGRHPLFQVKMDFQSAIQPPEQLPGLVLRPLPPAEATAHSDLTVYFTELPDRVGVVWEHNTDLFETTTIADLATDLERVLRRVVEEPAIRLSTLRGELTSEAERRRIEREREFQATRRDELRSFRRRAAVV